MTLDVFLHYFEYVAAAVALAYVILQIFQKPLMWYLAIFTALFYFVVYVHNELYAMALVQVYLVGAGIYGLVEWTRSKKKAVGTENEGRILIRPFEWKVGAVSIVLAVAVFILLFHVLPREEGGALWRPAMDAFLATNTMLATFFMGRRYIVAWVMWFLNDIISTYAYFHLGMYPTMVLYAIYVFTAVVGYLNWKKNGVWEK